MMFDRALREEGHRFERLLCLLHAQFELLVHLFPALWVCLFGVAHRLDKGHPVLRRELALLQQLFIVVEAVQIG